MSDSLTAETPEFAEAKALVRKMLPSYADVGQVDIGFDLLVSASRGDLEWLELALTHAARDRRLEIVVEHILLPPCWRVTWRPASTRTAGVHRRDPW